MPGISAGIQSPSLREGNLHPSGASSKHLAPQLNNRPPRFGISLPTLAVDSLPPHYPVWIVRGCMSVARVSRALAAT